MRTAPIVALALFTCPSSPAQDPASDPALAPFRAVAGDWTGALAYRDYGSGERVSIPANVTIDVAPDCSYVVRRIEYLDPGRQVHAVDTLAAGREPDQLVSTFVQGGDVEQTRYEIGGRDVEDAGSWSMVLSSSGRDGDEDVDIRVTVSLRDGVLRSRKAVRASGDTDAEWRVRNEIELRRPKPDASALIGTWRVDLRPTPDAEPYYEEMVIESVDDRKVAGRFYGTEVDDGRLDATWGELRIAFVTNDGSGAYHTSGVLRGDQIVGTTHSIGRGFLSRWTATRKE